MGVGYNGSNARGVIKNTFLLPKSSWQVTACHLVVDKGNTDELDKLCEWGKEKSNREEITRTMSRKEICDRKRDTVQLLWARQTF
jgi:hypothetical protein